MSQNIPHFSGNNGPQMGPARRNDGPQNHPQQGPQGGHFQGYPQGHSGAPPALPRLSIPVDLRGPTIQIQDVREDLMSESDMKEELSDYVIVRFEKVNDKDEIDEHGRPKWPSWEQAIKTEDWSIPKKEAIRKIRQLNYTTKSVLDKKNSLTPPLKRQIDRTQEELTRREELERREPGLAKYQWTLAQIDHQLRAIEPYFPNSLNYPSGRGHQSITRRISSKRSHSKGSSRHSKKKKAYERLSLTAYFKRVPRPGVDIQRMWQEHRENINSRGGIRAFPGEIHGAFPPMQPNIAFQTQQQQPQQQQHTGKERGPPPPPPPNHIPPGLHPQGQHPQGPHPQGPQPIRPNMPQHGGPGRQQNKKRGMGGARHSGSSDSESDSRSSRHSSSNRTHTPPSSISDHRGGGHHKDHPHRVPGAVNHPHAHPLGHGLPRVNSMPRISVPPYPVSHEEDESVASHIERVREDAYRRGRLDARLAEELAFSSAARGRQRPRIIQKHSPSPPPPSRIYRARSDDDDDEVRRVFARLSVYDRDEDEDVDVDVDNYRRGDASRRRRREFEYRAQRGSVLEDDPFANPSSPSLSSSYNTYSADGRGRRRVEIHPEPHHPLSTRVRRVVSYY
ncbi:hypothetical protein F4782DRAFT_53706 [Xylaria castorea]|nr:hypothetical protein F4782DRAFT_53706 [Xylaria castorea]